jgi:shikimate kinase
MEKTKLLFKRRLPLYRKAADIIVTTDNKTIKEVADEIVRKTAKYI